MSGLDKQLKRLLNGHYNYGFDRDFLKRARFVKENAGLEWVAAYDEVMRKLTNKKQVKKCVKCHCCGRNRKRKKAFAAWKGPTRIWICKECNRWIEFAKDHPHKVSEAVKKLKLRELTEGSDFLTKSNKKRKKTERKKAQARLREKESKEVEARLIAKKKLPGLSNRRYGQQGYGKATNNPAGPRDRRDEQAGYGKATTDSQLRNEKRFQPGGMRNPMRL